MVTRMVHRLRLCVLLLAPLLCIAEVWAQEHRPPTQPDTSRIVLDVVVSGKSGLPVTGLQQQDFTLLDNKVPQTIASFQAVDGRQAPIEVVLVVDAINTGYDNLSYERVQIDKFLRADAGKLGYPTALVVLTDTSAEISNGFTTDGNTLSNSLEQYTVGLRTVGRDAGFYGATEQFELSLKDLHELAERDTAPKGRKVVLWISPGWPLLSGPNVILDEKQQQGLFAEIVSLSTELRQARITLYSIDPLGTADAGGFRTFYWKNFVKGVSKPSQVDPADLSLEVLASQSGGVALNSSNSVTAELQQCLADLGNYYELSFDAMPGDRPQEYHHLEVKLAKPGLTARTRQGYYSRP